MNRRFWSFRTSAPADTCETIEPLLSLAADGMASPGETQRIEAHLPSCTDCRAALSWMQATRTALSSRPVAIPPPDLHSRIALAIVLSSRPAVAPPPDLHSRIVRAIAASSAAPVSLRPARVFTLRTAYAAAASITALGIALSYGLLHSSNEVTAKHSLKPVVAAVVPSTKTPAAPKITKRLLVASVPTKFTPVKHVVIARKAAPIAVTPLAHTASNDAPSKLIIAPQVIKATVHHAPLSPQIASRDIAPAQKHSTEKHAPLPVLKTPAPKLPDTVRVAKIIKEPIHIPLHLDIQPTKVTNDVPVARTASAQAPSPAPSDPLGFFKARPQTASATPIHYSVPQTYCVVTRVIQTVSSNDHIPVPLDIHSP